MLHETMQYASIQLCNACHLSPSKQTIETSPPKQTANQPIVVMLHTTMQYASMQPCNACHLSPPKQIVETYPPKQM